MYVRQIELVVYQSTDYYKRTNVHTNDSFNNIQTDMDGADTYQ